MNSKECLLVRLGCVVNDCDSVTHVRTYTTYTHTHTHTHTHTCTRTCTHTCTHTHTHTHARTRTRAHTHTHTRTHARTHTHAHAHPHAHAHAHTGTSMAAPHVAGVMAKYLSRLPSSTTPTQLTDLILKEYVFILHTLELR